MEQKIKFVLIGLVGALAISVFFIFQFHTAKQTVEQERNNLLAENQTLTKKAEDSLQKLRNLEDKLTALNKELDKITQDKDDIQKKFDLANKEKQELIERLKARRAEGAAEVRPLTKEEPLEALSQPTEAYWAGILKAKTDLELQLSNLRKDLKNTQITNEQLQREKNALDLDMKNLARDKEDLKRQMEYNQKMLDSISQELVREKNDKILIEDSLKPIKTENASLRRQLAGLNSQKTNLERKLEQLKQDRSALEDKLQKMGVSLKEKFSKISQLKEEVETAAEQAVKEEPMEKRESVELPPIVVRPQAAEAVPLGKTATRAGGSILAINKENNFVIVDMGEDAGLKTGDVLQAYRDGKPIGSLEVIQTRRNIAACDIKKEASPLKIGDTVR
ncbi:MAG: hypothetical protein A3K83_01155 [Omnitrophica WOR_2 bacterium RBG_13_44_8b]|nr:MAG: hypothetical protein A3K83_01155 [Omnitrophica WOR_2 bacterium RBG_13_44_8b]